MTIRFGQFIINVDTERTRAFYEAAPGIDCACQGCRNFSLAAASLPEEARVFLRTLGIAPQKPAETWVNCRQEDGRVLYGGFYHLCGTLLQGEGGWHTVAEDSTTRTSVWDPESCYLAAENFRVAFTGDTALVAPDFPRPVLQLEISAVLPWLLDEENDYPR